MRFPWRRSSDTPTIPQPPTRPGGWRTEPRDHGPETAVRNAHDHLLDVARLGGGGAYGYGGLRSPAQAAAVLGELSALSEDLDTVLSRVTKYLHREQAAGRLTALEGPFTDEPVAALATIDLWLAEATSAAGTLKQNLDNAHIAASGLARTEHRHPARM